jgi:hypothetical protein
MSKWSLKRYKLSKCTSGASKIGIVWILHSTETVTIDANFPHSRVLVLLKLSSQKRGREKRRDKQKPETFTDFRIQMHVAGLKWIKSSFVNSSVAIMTLFAISNYHFWRIDQNAEWFV